MGYVYNLILVPEMKPEIEILLMIKQERVSHRDAGVTLIEQIYMNGFVSL